MAKLNVEHEFNSANKTTNCFVCYCFLNCKQRHHMEREIESETRNGRRQTDVDSEQ